jgi:hypothetical protein
VRPGFYEEATVSVRDSSVPVRDLLAQVTCLVVLTAGEQSFMDESMRATAAMMPRAQVGTIPHAQHLALVDNPEGFPEPVRPFLRES